MRECIAQAGASVFKSYFAIGEEIACARKSFRHFDGGILPFFTDWREANARRKSGSNYDDPLAIMSAGEGDA